MLSANRSFNFKTFNFKNSNKQPQKYHSLHAMSNAGKTTKWGEGGVLCWVVGVQGGDADRWVGGGGGGGGGGGVEVVAPN